MAQSQSPWFQEASSVGSMKRTRTPDMTTLIPVSERRALDFRCLDPATHPLLHPPSIVLRGCSLYYQTCTTGTLLRQGPGVIG